MKQLTREKRIFQVSIIGILTNILLVAFKAVVGLISGSISIVMDAVNNLSDAISSVITIVGMKLASKAPDKKHPYGHGRYEHMTAMLISAIVIIAGATSLVESVKKIIDPSKPNFTTPMIIIISVGILVKVLLGLYFKKAGSEVKSDSLIASGADALFDGVIAFGTLVSAIVMVMFKFSIDGYLGVLISIVIIKSGIEMILEPLNQILGNRVDSVLSGNIKSTVKSFDEVNGAYDLILHSYGPENMIGSIHVEVDESLSAADICKLSRKIQKKVLESYGVFLTIGIYAKLHFDDDRKNIQKHIINTTGNTEGVLQTHGLWIDDKEIEFDIVVDFEVDDIESLKADIIKKISDAYPKYNIVINIDRDYAD